MSAQLWRRFRRRQRLARIARALETMEEDSYAVFVLARFENLSDAQIAQRLGLPSEEVERLFQDAMWHIMGHVDPDNWRRPKAQ